MQKTYAILVLLAAVVLGVYLNSPSRFFTEDVMTLVKNGVVIAYDDNVDGGNSDITFENKNGIANFNCTLDSDESKDAWCGLLFDLTQDTIYRDWTFVDSIIVDLESAGTNEILLKIWTFDPDVTDKKINRSYRLLMKEIPLTKGNQRISIPFEQFYTPDFWYDDNKVNRELSDRHQESVARVEIAPGWNQPRGNSFTLKVKSIQAKGLSNFAFGVVLFIMVGLFIVAIGRRHAIHKDLNCKETEKSK